ncbi:MAG: ABC transporter ATP-binding protein [Rubrivivax sp.]|nr:ABC transporter ATP-binding protein [Rubrivivax sp.]
MRLLRTAADRTVIRRLSLALVLIATGSLLSGLAPLALKELVDSALPAGGSEQSPGHLQRSVLLAAGYVGALAAVRVLAELRLLLVGGAEQRLSANLTRHGFERLLRLPLSRHLDQRTGALVQSLDNASAGCQMLVSQLAGGVVPVIVELCSVIGVLIYLGQASLVIAFAATALAYLGVHAVGAPKLADRARSVAEAAQDMRASLTEGMFHPESIQGLGAEDTMCQRVQQSLVRLEQRWRALHLQRIRLGLAVSGCFGMCLAALMALALQGLHHGTLTVGSFVLVNVYLLQMLRPLDTLGAATRDISQALGFIRPFLPLYAGGEEPASLPSTCPTGQAATATKPHAKSPTAAGSRSPRAAPALSVRDLHFSYDARRPVLQGLNLDIAPGSTLALVGPSGCGKSSLLRLLLRLCEPQSGALLLDGRPLSELPIAHLRASIGVVFQESLLLDDTLAANIALGCPHATRHDIEQAARRAQLQNLAAALPAAYDTRIGERGLRLSGGERQRIAIARALVRRPRLLLLDEATSMLDTATESALLGELKEATATCTTLMIAHRLSSAQHAQRIAVLDAGRIVACDNHTTLLAQGGTYALLWRAQALVEQGAPT